MSFSNVVKIITPYIRISRPLTQVSQTQILIGYLFGSGGIYTTAETITILQVMAALFVTYTGIYSFNDVIDADLDRKHTKKKIGRMVAANRISKQNGILYSAFCVLIGLAWGLNLSPKVFVLQSLLLTINFLYSMWFKHIKFVDILLNSITHPVRAFIGVSLTGLPLLNYAPFFLIHLILAISSTTIRRYREIVSGNTEARPVLKKYTQRELIYISHTAFYIGALGLIVTQDLIPLYIKLLSILYPLCTVFLYERSSFVKQIMNNWYYGCNAGDNKTFRA